MAKLTDRTELTAPADGDWYVTTDVSDTSDAATGTDKKITWSNIKATLKTYFDTLYGNVSKVGTPVDNQVGVWTGNGTIEGDTALTFDTTSNQLKVGETGADVTTYTSVQVNDNGTKGELSLNVAGSYPAINIQSTGGTTASPTATSTGIAGEVNFYVYNSTPAQKQIARIQTNATDTTASSEDSKLSFAVVTAGTLADKLVVEGTAVKPFANDGTALGTTAAQFSDLFLAEGGVINWDNGDATITQTGNSVELAGADLTVPNLTVGAAGTITLSENASIALDPAGSADGKYSGITITGTAGADLAFGDLIYLDPTDSRWELADANAAAAADGDARGILGICVNDPSGDGQPVTVLLHGVVRADAAFPALTIGAPVYVSETAGDIVVAQPTTTDVVIRIVGIAITADEIFFNPDNSWITHT